MKMAVETAALSLPMNVDGSGARMESLFDMHHERLYRLARRLSPHADEAGDLVQETYLRAAQKLGSVPSGAPDEEAWLVRVLVNICRDRWRRDAVRRRDQPHAPLVAPSGEAALIAKSTIWGALDRLSPRRRAVLVMCELEGASIAAVARTLGLTSVTVRWHLSKGRRELAAVITIREGHNREK
jgi:RNA polymerase sigma factor (sigma-70 family)